MNCYFHPQVEGVVSCGKCGVAMCKECEGKAFMRLPSGQALCNRCSLNEAATNVAADKDWLKKRLIKILIMVVLIGIGIIVFAANLTETPMFMAFICWLIAGIIGNIGAERKSSGGGMLVKIGEAIGTSIFSPVGLIFNVIGYLRTLSVYKQDLRLLESIKTAVNN